MIKFEKVLKENVCFAVGGKTKKNIRFPSNWQKTKKTNISKIKGCSYIGMLTGPINDLTVIDLDKLTNRKEDRGLKCGLTKYKKLLKKYNNGDDLLTPTDFTQGGGNHLYFKYDKDILGWTGKKYSIDTKGNGGCVFIPPSKGYTWKYHMNDYEKIKIPDWLKKWILKSMKKKSKIIKKNVKQNKIKTVILGRRDGGKNKNDYFLRNYLDCLDIDRFTNYSDWIKIGFILFNEKCSCDLWDDFSRKAVNYDNTCYQKWQTFTNKRDIKANLKTLKGMCIEDNVEKYKIAIVRDTRRIIQEIFKCGANDTDMTHLFYSYEPDRYIFDSDNEQLYKINKYGIFEKDSKNMMNLRRDIYLDLTIRLNHEVDSNYNGIENLESKINLLKKLTKIKHYLKRAKNQKIIANELCTLYSKKKLFEKLDNVNDNIIGFDNGVFDFDTMKFRNAKPNEYVTCTTGYKYKKENKKDIKYINEILSSIFTFDEEKYYILKTLSTCLVGDNTLEEFYIWIGNGSNGKGVLANMLNYTLGDYYDSMDIEYICKNKYAGSATGADPVMVRKKNCRLVITTEPEGTACLKSAKLKELSGRDPIQVRDLYKSSFTFVPKFKMIIQTNHEIEIEGGDGGIRRRLKFLTFRNKFVDNPKLDCHRQIDRTLKHKLKNEKYRIAFFHILLGYYKQFIKDKNIIMPPSFQKETDEYLNDFDPVQIFIDEKIIITNNKKDFVSSSQLYQAYFEYNNGKTKSVNKNNFKRLLIGKGLTFKRTNKARGFSGIKLIEEYKF